MLDLILLRHGQSTWNAQNLFTGWVDVDLTEAGEAEATAGGLLLADEPGLDLRILHTSLQTRAIRTAELALRRLRRSLRSYFAAFAALSISAAISFGCDRNMA